MTIDEFFFPRNYKTLSLGFDQVIDKLQSLATVPQTNYPPYNIIRNGEKTSSDKGVSENYTIEVAIAGFAEEDVDIIVEDDLLKIVGKKRLDNSQQFIYKGIGSREFSLTFRLAEYMEVKDAILDSGILKITAERLTPIEKQPRKVYIKSSGGFPAK